jgi:hypothetical protein
VRWVVERYAARGPLSERLAEIAHADDLIPLVAIAFLFALSPTTHVAVRVPLRDWPLLTAALGVVLGGVSALLVRSNLVMHETWGVLFGTSLLAVGTAARLDLSTLTACFFMGLSTSMLSRFGSDLRAMVAPTERPVLLPLLLLAGTRLDLHPTPLLAVLAAAAIGGRVLAKIVVGALLALVSPPARKAGPFGGVALLSSGALALSIGLAFSLRFPGRVGDTVLAIAALSATFGEFVAPSALRRMLRAAGEIEDPAPPSLGGAKSSGAVL